MNNICCSFFWRDAECPAAKSTLHSANFFFKKCKIHNNWYKKAAMQCLEELMVEMRVPYCYVVMLWCQSNSPFMFMEILATLSCIDCLEDRCAYTVKVRIYIYITRIVIVETHTWYESSNHNIQNINFTRLRKVTKNVILAVYRLYPIPITVYAVQSCTAKAYMQK